VRPPHPWRLIAKNQRVGVVRVSLPWQGRRVRDHVSLVTQISKGLIRDQRTRRLIMFWGLIGALVMLFLGSVFFNWMREHPIFFLFYWGACAWVTLLAMLLAIFDLLLLRAAARQARRKLETDYLEELRRQHKDDSDPPGTRGA
jgi:cobalamin biosynthesis protein CobD/CbiB